MTKGDPSYKIVSGRAAEPLCETIAKVWFMHGIDPQRQRPELWDNQPQDIKTHFRRKADMFLKDPDRPYREHGHLLYLLDNFLVDYRRGYVDGMEVVQPRNCKFDVVL